MIVTSPEPEDPQDRPVPTPAFELDGVDSLWKKAAELVSERNRNRLDLGQVLNELNEKYAKPGQGTFVKRAMDELGISRSTAYRWIGAYRTEAGLPPLRHSFDEVEEIPISTSEFAVEVPESEADEPAGPPPGDPPVEEKNPEPTIVSVRINLTPVESRVWEVGLERVVRFLKANGITRRDGKVIENRADAAFFCVLNMLSMKALKDWEAQYANR